MTARKNIVVLSRPRDESLEAFKDWILEFFTTLTGRPADDSISEEEWIESHRTFWAGEPSAGEPVGGTNA